MGGSSGTVGFGELGGFEERRGWGGIGRKKRERRKRRDRRKWRRHEVGTVMVVVFGSKSWGAGRFGECAQSEGGRGGCRMGQERCPELGCGPGDDTTNTRLSQRVSSPGTE